MNIIRETQNIRRHIIMFDGLDALIYLIVSSAQKYV